MTVAFSPDPLARYDEQLLASAELQDELRRTGYAVLPPLLGSDDLAALESIGQSFVERLDEPFGDLFLAAGRILDAELRAEVTDAAGDIVREHLRPLFVEGTEILGAPLQVKPPSPDSALNPHQDQSLLDEADRLGVYCWIPLVDVDERNGWLEVVPGSHRLGNVQRTLNVPWQFAGQEEVLRRHGVGLEMPAGSVCLFDASLVHGSPPNRSADIRFALNNFAKPPDAPMVHFFADEATTPGCVEAWEIDVSFFLEEDIMSRPSERYRSLGERPHVTVSLTDEELDRVLQDLREQVADFATVPRAAVPS
ncbi:MAG: phytanoyl-CoA dioxygenase family protein [Acidimicrobiales bacterium]|nr:phytanoyl-CoA dioxygenase family protein [Acidimicrobiales bacterium]